MAEYACLYASSVVIARGLGVEGNGLYAGLTSLMQGLLVASAIGADAALNKHIPQMAGEDAAAGARSLLWRTLAVRLGLLVLVGATGIVLAPLFAHPLAGSFQKYGIILLCYSIVRAATQLMGVALVASFRPAANAVVTVAVRALELSLLLMLASRGLTIEAILRLLALTGALQVMGLLFFGRPVLAGKWSRMPIWPVFTFGILFWINSIVDFFLGRFGDVFLLSILLADRAPASLYDVASSLNQAAFLATTAGFAGLSLARLAGLATTAPDRMNEFYSTLVRLISLFTIPLLAFLLFHSEPVIGMLYSSDYAVAGSVLQILVLFRLGARLFGGGENAEYLLAKGRVIPLVIVGLAAAAINIGLDLLLIPLLQARGAALASGTANLLVNALGWNLVRRERGPRLQTAFWFQLVVLCLASSWVSGLFLGDWLPVLLAVYVVLCLLAAKWARPLRQGDVDALGGIHPRLARAARIFAQPPAAEAAEA